MKVFFQEKAWVDRNVSNAIAATHFGAFVAQHNKVEETLLFCDNLDAQVTPQFLQILRQFNCSRFLYPTDTTELVQAVDGGLQT